MALSDYVLARGETLDDLQKSVLAYAADGFVPSGGIQADAAQGMFVQPMIKGDVSGGIAGAVPDAGPTTAGLVKQGTHVADAQVDNSDAGAKVNALLSSLRTAGVIASS